MCGKFCICYTPRIIWFCCQQKKGTKKQRKSLCLYGCSRNRSESTRITTKKEKPKRRTRAWNKRESNLRYALEEAKLLKPCCNRIWRTSGTGKWWNMNFVAEKWLLDVQLQQLLVKELKTFKELSNLIKIKGPNIISKRSYTIKLHQTVTQWALCGLKVSIQLSPITIR